MADQKLNEEKEKKPKVELTWLQCQLQRDEWDNLNERRAKLNLKWADLIVPGTKKYLDYLETTPSQQVETTAIETKHTNPVPRRQTRRKSLLSEPQQNRKRP